MPTFENPAADADEAQLALRGLAHATRSIRDPQQIYEILGSLSAAASSLSQSLHQLGSYHDGPSHRTAWTPDDSHSAHAVSYQVSYGLHRAGDIVRQAAESIDHAHEAQTTLGYHRQIPAASPSASRSTSHGLGL